MSDLPRRRSEPDWRCAESGAAVAVEGLTKVFPVPFHRKSIVAVRDLKLSVEAGEVYGLLGPNGSGKSTTLKIILGLVSPTRGRTKIFGRDSSLVESREAVGFLPENPYFYKFLTGEETLRFFGKLCRLNGPGLKSRVHELLELVGLTNARDQRLSTYSKGMLQRIGLAQALINEPKLVVLDEPTAGVDPAVLARLYREKFNDHAHASECYAKAARLPGAPSYDRRFSAYELSYCEGHEREAHERLRALYEEGEKERLPTLIKRLKFLEEKLNVPPEQRIPHEAR